MINIYLNNNEIYKLFEKCSKERDTYSINYAVQRGLHQFSTQLREPVIFIAAMKNNLLLVQDLISCGVNPSVPMHSKFTLLHYCSMYNSIEVAEYLVTLKGVDLNAKKCN